MVTGIKMEVTPDLSERVQEIVFKNGGFWVGGEKNVSNIEQKYIHIYADKNMQFGNSRVSFGQHDNEEISPYDFIASQGQQKWLPKIGDEAEFGTCGENWHTGTFNYYLTKEVVNPFFSSIGNAKYCRPIQKKCIISIDGKDIEVSQESYESFKKQFKDK